MARPHRGRGRRVQVGQRGRSRAPRRCEDEILTARLEALSSPGAGLRCQYSILRLTAADKPGAPAAQARNSD